jgi:hypothetical protein
LKIMPVKKGVKIRVMGYYGDSWNM